MLLLLLLGLILIPLKDFYEGPDHKVVLIRCKNMEKRVTGLVTMANPPTAALRATNTTTITTLFAFPKDTLLQISYGCTD